MNEFKNLDEKRQTNKENDYLTENSFLWLQEISDKVQKIDKKDQEFIIHRIFEHSVRDGLKLMENNGFTSSDYFDSTIHPNFYIKHPDLVKKIVLEAKNLVKSETDKNRLKKLEASVKENDILLEGGKFKVTGSSFGSSQGLKTQEAKRLLSHIDDLYSEFIKDKKFIYKTEENFRSKGEKLGQDVLRQIEMSLNSNFYRWNVLNNLLSKLLINSPEKVNNLILSIFSTDKGLKERYKGDINLYREKIKKGFESKEDLFTEIVKNSGIKKYDSYESYLDEDTVDKIYGFYGFDPEPTKLRTQYKPLNILVSTEISTAEKELVKEIGDDLIWSDEKGEYKLKENNETKYLTEEKILDKLEDLINQKVDKDPIALGLAGLDSDRAWKMRQDFIDQGADKDYIALGLAGLDSDRAWKMRQDFIDQGADKDYIALGLAGLDSDKAWKMRQDFIKEGVDKGWIARGLAGLDSDKAWKMRQDFIKEGVDKDYIALGLAGLDSDKAWKMRQDLIKEGVFKEYIAEGLAGLDSDKAWKMRQDFIKEGVGKGAIAQGLAGLDSDKAWKMRQDFIKEGVNKGDIALGLAGLDSDRAWKMRQDFIDQGADKDYIALGLAGDYITFVWQLDKNKLTNKDKAFQKLTLLNLINKVSSNVLSKERKIEEHELKENNETRYLTEEKILAKLEDLIDQGVDKYRIAQGLAGLDSDRAWKMRQDFIEQGVDKEYIAQGLAGLDSDRAWKMRQDFIDQKINKGWIAQSLAGLDSDRAWKMRQDFINQKVDKGDIAVGLAGLDSDRAWKMRQDFFDQKVNKRWISLGLAGLDSDRAWKMRQDFIEQGVDKYYIIAQSLAGLDSDRAWKMRQDIIDQKVNKGYIAQGLAGLDSDRAWKMRQDFIEQGVDKGPIALGLAGIDSDRAWKMRQDFIDQGVDKYYIAKSLAGDYITFVWQLKNKEKINTSINITKKNKPSVLDKKTFLEEIRKYFKINKEKDKKAESWTADVSFVNFVNSFIKESPKSFLKTISARKDNHILSNKLMYKIFPSTYRKKEKSYLDKWMGGFSSPEGYLEPHDNLELKGGDPESEKIRDFSSEILRFREPVSGFIVSNLYSKVVDGFKWSSSLEFPVAKNNIKKGREITIALPKVGSSVVLPRFIDSNIITERVKGIKGEKEFPLSVNVDSFGNGLVLDTKKSEEIIYSLETDEIPRVMKEIQKDEYDDYKNYFVKRYGKEIVSPIMELPEEIDLFLDKIKDRSPADKVILIEKFVRSICHYDMKNKEVADKKTGVSFEEILLIMEERMEEIKNNNKEDNLSNKKYAGVCSDFAILTTAILRKAGFMSGVLTGFYVSNSKSAYTGDAHGTSFVVWPEKQNGNSVFVVDGTPSGIDGISTDSLEEKKLKRESILEEIKEKAEWEIDEIQKVLDSYDEESIEKLTNGQLEKALNNILDYGVGQGNLEAITTVFQSYWYSPLHKMDLDQVEGKIDFINFFNEEIKRAKEGQPIDEIENSGSKLFEIIRDFIQRFSSGNDKKIGFEIARKIRGLARSSLSQEELKAITVIVSYLEAKKMK